MLPICNVQIKAHKPCYIRYPDKDDKSLGAELKRRRLVLEWRQGRCAEYFEVYKDSYQKWEWNKIIPDIKKRKYVNEFLDFNFWDDDSISLSNSVLLFRVEYKLTMLELAIKISVSASTIERIENNSSLISDEMRRKIKSYIQNFESEQKVLLPRNM